MGQYIIGGSLKVGGDIDIGVSKLTTSVANGNVEIAANGTGKVKIGNLYMPTSAGSNGNVLAVDGSGNLSFVANSQSVSHVAVNYTAADTAADTHFAGIDTKLGDLTTAVNGKLTELFDDTAPMLGGNLNMNGYTLTSAGNTDVSLLPDGTGRVLIGGIAYAKRQEVVIADDNTAGSPVYTYEATGNDIVFIDYALHRTGDGSKFGTLTVATDGTNVNLIEAGGAIGTPGVTFSAAMQGGSVVISYTTAATGNTGVMAFSARSWYVSV